VTSPDVIVVGAGALGWACAQAAAACGAQVTLLDQGGPSASSVAAGMLAPALESALEDAAPERANLYRAARDLWPSLSGSLDLELDRAGATWVGDDPCGVHDRLTRLGFAAELGPEGVFTADDWLLDPEEVLERSGRGVRRLVARAATVVPGRVTLANGAALDAGHVVIAVGASAIVADAAADALSRVVPVRGQILLLRGVPPPPATLRAEGLYLVPRGPGLLVGASMETGRSDLEPDEGVTAELLARATALWPAAASASDILARVGVRGATPDGLPLVGPVAAGLSVALAPRRNGWLLAPLVGAMVAAYAAGDDPGPYAKALDPLRFKRS
jgi:glycine oxidase